MATFFREPRRASLLLLFLSLLAYGAILNGSFQFDDFNVIVDEARVHSLGAWLQGAAGLRPLLKLSYTLNWIAGAGAAGFLAVNLALHLANTWMVHRILLRAFSAAGLLEGAGAAFLGGLAFALHPMQVESVAYITGRSVSLSTALVLGSALAYLGARDGAGRAARLSLSSALFALALLVKETALVLPGILALLELGRRDGPRRPFRGPWPHWLMAAGAMAVLAVHPGYRRLAAYSFALRGPGEQARAALEGLRYLAGTLVWPLHLNLDPPLKAPPDWSSGLLLFGAGWALLAVAGVLALRRRPWLGVGLLWGMLGLLPTQGVIPRLDLANERHIYLALVGFGMALGGGLAALPPRAAGLAGVALALALGGRTYLRVGDYRDETAMWTSSLAAAPQNPRAWNNLGVARWHARDVPGARQAFQEALRLDPRYGLAQANLERAED